jgi:26 proteasome complex subunit DSS1
MTSVKEDDEFQDFEFEDWSEQDEEKVDPGLWIQNWDDETVNDDFSKQLRAELEKRKANGNT